MFVSFGIKDMIDILLVAFFLYQVYKLMKSSGTLAIFGGVVSVIVVWLLVSQVLEMRLMGTIFDKFISVGFLVIVILFQDDIRRFLVALGSNRGWKFIVKLFSRKDENAGDKDRYIAPVVLACLNMSRKKTGALIVVRKEMDLSAYIHTGEMFTAEVNARLIENIFFKNSPLHDGAMIIADNEIKAVGCILPVAQNANISKDMGLRHRAGLGMSKETDATIIIVSEERGTIAVAQNGKLIAPLSAEELQQILLEEKNVE
ncbi:MAG: diadenylate cyclase CdaA [Tannerella sp.]|nr:diadenylate cyclase CdaA [Tannerella sp.]